MPSTTDFHTVLVGLLVTSGTHGVPGQSGWVDSAPHITASNGGITWRFRGLSCMSELWPDLLVGFLLTHLENRNTLVWLGGGQ